MSNFLVVWVAVIGEPSGDFSRDLAFSFPKHLLLLLWLLF